MDMQEAIGAIRALSVEEVSEKLARESIGSVRSELLLDVINGRVPLSYIPALDIQLFAIKALRRDLYDALPDRGHPYASWELYEYDPAKNGKNIIKHGVGFHEVASLSSNFGTLSVAYPHSDDEDRVVIFSNLNSGDNARNLDLPYPHIDGLVYVMTIAQQMPELRYRFISSRIIDQDDYRRHMTQAFRDIPVNTQDEKRLKKDFVDVCEGILKRNMFWQ
ncbi:BrnT family toxin [Dyella lutea]|uniref:BrnT family toxin n=1 Tax=Dyella lutea TaxID=2950441 RepID=A0ABT1FCQ2_9GAMM|nr:BrnT family toxin [Dyella lutea]MCP1375157.1 BrnT family toxin [Dyella lutea]